MGNQQNIIAANPPHWYTYFLRMQGKGER